MFTLILFIFYVFLLYLYLYSSIIFQLFHTNNDNMKHFWFDNYFKYWIYLLKITGLFNKIKFLGISKIDSKQNIILMNHSSIFDNFILGNIFLNSSYTWNDIKTVSKISSRQIQNKVMNIHGNLLLNKDMKHDLRKKNTVFTNWKLKNPLNIVLFPEGTIYQGNVALSRDEKACLKKCNIVNGYNNLLYPKTGIFNYIMEEMSDNLEYIYDITTIYTVKNKRIYGNEWNMINYLFHPNFKVYINIEKYSLGNKIIKIKPDIYKIKLGRFIDNSLLEEFDKLLSLQPKVIIVTQHLYQIFNEGLQDNTDVNLKKKYINLINNLFNFPGVIISKVRGEVKNEGIIFPLLSHIVYGFENTFFEINDIFSNNEIKSILLKRLSNNIINYYKLSNENITLQKGFTIGLIDESYTDIKWDNLMKNIDNVIKNHEKLD